MRYRRLGRSGLLVSVLGLGANSFGGRLDVAAARPVVDAALEAGVTFIDTADWIDLYQLHRPGEITPFEETLETLDGLIREGKVRYVGSSNLAAWELLEADWIGRCHRTAGFISAQNHYSLLERSAEAELVPACVTHDVSLLAYYPLASGLLTGRLGANPAESPLPPLSARGPPGTAPQRCLRP